METLEFTQEELKLLQFSLNHLVKFGQVTLADIDMIYPLVKKVQAKIKPEAAVAPQDHKQKSN